MNLKFWLKANVLLLALYLPSFLFYKKLIFLSAPVSILGILVFLFSGINALFLVKVLLKRNYDLWEGLTLAALSLFIFYPVLLLAEFLILKKVYEFLPLANYAFILLLSVVLARIKKISWKEILLPVSKINTKQILSSTLFHALIIQLFLAIIIFSAYKFLPDKDPMKWVFRLTDLYKKNSLSPITYRPLFSSMTFIFTTLSQTTLFFFFKFIIPFYYLFALLPIWMVAQKINSRNSQLLLLLTPLISSNVILYSQTAMPQVFVITLSYFFIFFLFLHYQTKDTFYYFLAGVVSAVAALYHEIFAIVFLIWILMTIFSNKFSLICKGTREKFYLLIIVLSNISLFKFDFIYSWVRKMGVLLPKMQANWLFPAHYKNIDGNEMGWGNLWGVLKFYLYYAGPFVLLMTAIFLFLLLREAAFRKILLDKIRRKEILIVGISFLAFFMMSEVFPRFPGIALLPDRSWVFGAIFSSLILFILVIFWEEHSSHRKRIVQSLLIISAFISITGAIYINYQKKYLVTQSQLDSAVWISKNLPDKSLLLSSSIPSYVTFTTQVQTSPIPESYYYSEEILKLVKKSDPSQGINDAEFMEAAKKNSQNCASMDSLVYDEIPNVMQSKAISEIYRTSMSDLKASINALNSQSVNVTRAKDVYIYYSEKSESNPYIDRPYEIGRNNRIKEFVFEKYPNKFQKVYENNADGKAIIWKVL